MSALRLRIVGPGRAGGALQLAAERVGWEVRAPVRRGESLDRALDDVDLVVVATPDAAVAEVAAAMPRDTDVVVAHLAGSLGLDVLAGHARRGALHPVVSLPSAEVGADLLLDGAWFAIAGDPVVARLVDDLGGRAVEVADDARTMHHAAATVAANHLVALLAQVDRLAARAGVPLEAYLAIAHGAIDNVGRLGPAGALTGPVARFDTATVGRHLDELDERERALYLALADEAALLAGRPTPVGGPAWR
ncbi:MAG: DUF2520 domain-containing protein [Actinomycetota bacterium]